MQKKKLKVKKLRQDAGFGKVWSVLNKGKAVCLPGPGQPTYVWLTETHIFITDFDARPTPGIARLYKMTLAKLYMPANGADARNYLRKVIITRMGGNEIDKAYNTVDNVVFRHLAV